MSEASVHLTQLERITTGIPGLDEILDGGLIRRGIYIVRGVPGAGKTILGNQMCFHHVREGGKAVYITLLAEPHGRMLSHLSTLRFFDPAVVSDALTYVSGYGALEQHGLVGLLELLRKIAREKNATLLMLDGLVSALDFADTSLSFKKFIHELNTVTGMIGCTTLLLTSAIHHGVSPEHTITDGVIELRNELEDQPQRLLVVHKLRGSNHLHGHHAFTISSDGLTVYPRLEARHRTPTSVPAASDERLSVGSTDLDTMLGGGLRTGTMTLLLGPSGSGKTTIGLNFLAAGAHARMQSLYFGFQESPPRLYQRGDSLGLALKKHAQEGLLAIEWIPDAEPIADAIADRLLSLVRRRGVRCLFIDGLNGLSNALVRQQRIDRFFTALTNELRALGVSTVYSRHTVGLLGPWVRAPLEGVSAIADNIIFLRQAEYRSEIVRVISILKTRESEHASEIRLFKIGPHGIEFGSMLGPSAEAILTGIVRSTGSDDECSNDPWASEPSRARRVTSSRRPKR